MLNASVSVQVVSHRAKPTIMLPAFDIQIDKEEFQLIYSWEQFETLYQDMTKVREEFKPKNA